MLLVIAALLAFVAVAIIWGGLRLSRNDHD